MSHAVGPMETAFYHRKTRPRMLYALVVALNVLIFLHFCVRLYLKSKARRCVAFFHPYCNAGGGGERVLWTAVASLQSEHPQWPCVIYTGDVDAPKQEILNKAQDRFGITLHAENISIIYLKHRWLIEEQTWPRFTLLGQSLGSVVLALEALSHCTPSIYIDSMGYAFTYPLVRLWTNAKVLSYTHYPTISTDMIKRVHLRQAGHTNPALVASSALLSRSKLIYYYAFAGIYRLCLLQSHQLMVNSTWTHNKIKALLPRKSKITIVYPPCDVKALASLPLSPREKIIFSLAQFRPEKEHAAQIRAMAKFCQSFPKESKEALLILAGSVRNSQDEDRVATLKELVRSLKLQDRVQFVVNAPYTELMKYFENASIGLSTMVDEHFGINVVELMAAGIIPIVHPSAGPLYDIVVPFEDSPTGFHASTPSEFAARIADTFKLSTKEQTLIRANARASVCERFSEGIFTSAFLEVFQTCIE